MFSKVFQLFLNTVMQTCNYSAVAFYERGNGGSSVRKMLAVFFTYINFHVVFSYEAMAATLAQHVKEWFLGIEEGHRYGRGLIPEIEAGGQASQEVGPRGNV